MNAPIVCGNWKMNTTVEEGRILLEEIVAGHRGGDVKLIIAPPYTHLMMAGEILAQSGISLGAQNLSKHEPGAHTGEIAGEMLRDIGAEYVLIGHSEVRESEEDALIHEKLIRALETGLTPILCVGERESVRTAGKTLSFIEGQLSSALAGIEKETKERIVFAYEPIWAIGTGKAATRADAEEVARFIKEKVGTENVVLYGGSVKPENTREIMAGEHVDGLLVGGASLKASDFLAIAKESARHD